MDGLLNAAIDLAIKLLGKFGTHAPFALAVRIDGTGLNAFANDTEIRDWKVLEESILTDVRAMISRGEIRPVAFAHNVEYRSAVDGSHVDAIQIDLDSQHDRAVTCLLPYTLGAGYKVFPGQLAAINPVRVFFKQSVG